MNGEDVQEGWAERSTEFSPEYYAYYGPNETSEQVRRVLDRRVGTKATVLELGCSSGRHLDHLREAGFEDLHGVDVNREAFEVMAAEYPALAAGGTFHRGTFEAVLPAFADGRFDAVFAVQTLQHVHPEAAEVFGEVARIAEQVVLTVECEVPGGADPEADLEGEPAGDSEREPAGATADPSAATAVTHVDGGLPLYYRNWRRVFESRGLRQTTARTVEGDVLRVFEPA